MRINIYNEEITYNMEVVEKSAEGRKFWGLRFYLLSHPCMYPPQHGDDDRSAVTFWFDDKAAAFHFLCQARERMGGTLYP